MFRAPRFGLPTLAVVVLLAAAACGGTAASGGETAVADVAADASSATAEEQSATTGPADQAASDPQEALLDFTRCMRDHGIDLPDPDFSGGGVIGGPGNGAFDPSDPDFQAAMEACQENLQGIQQQIGEADQQAFQEAALEFARCMREHGVDIPDPDFSQGGGFRIGPDGGIDLNDPDFRAANEACGDAFAGLPGPGGGNQGDQG